jgi:hypothetical protein
MILSNCAASCHVRPPTQSQWRRPPRRPDRRHGLARLLVARHAGLRHHAALRHRLADAALRYQPVVGVVTQSRVDGGCDSTRPDIHYSYTVNGVNYVGDRYRCWTVSTNDGNAERVVAAHPVGLKVGQMPLDANFMGAHPHNWLEAHVLRQEAEARLR